MSAHSSASRILAVPVAHVTTPGVETTGKLVRMSTRALTETERKRVMAKMADLVKEAGSQIAAARRVGISQQVYSRNLAGDNIGTYVAKLVAKYYHMTLDELLGPPAPKKLDELLRANDNRWSRAAIGSARAAALTHADSAERMSASEWAAMLDAYDRAIAAVVASHLANSRKKK